MTSIIFENARILDGRSSEGEFDRFVLVEDGVIREVSDRPITRSNSRRIDLRGATLMPGLIDCHVHVTAIVVDPAENSRIPDALVALYSAAIMRDMLNRGFTTVRDVGGATHPLALAIERGVIPGPRLIICGKALSQTGGHTDFRGRFEPRDAAQQAVQLGAMGRVCDGVDEVRRAARDELRKGADFLKIMANGGVASPTDPIAFMGFSEDEIRAVVEEAYNAQTYVAAHLYTDQAIDRAVRCGVRTVEHANLIETPTAEMLTQKNVMVCPTLVVYEALKKEGKALGLPQVSVDKIDDVRRSSQRSLEIMHRAGVKMAYGTDLLGEMHRYQLDEFELRKEILPAIEVIRSATCNAAELLGMEGKIGIVEPGAHADLIVVRGDPLTDISVMVDSTKMELIMKGGEAVKDCVM